MGAGSSKKRGPGELDVADIKQGMAYSKLRKYRSGQLEDVVSDLDLGAGDPPRDGEQGKVRNLRLVAAHFNIAPQEQPE